MYAHLTVYPKDDSFKLRVIRQKSGTLALTVESGDASITLFGPKETEATKTILQIAEALDITVEKE
tara:strand:- start:152 stop:349 length:198 start_codon:yes stop_codon:yes gene_type:complete